MLKGTSAGRIIMASRSLSGCLACLGLLLLMFHGMAAADSTQELQAIRKRIGGLEQEVARAAKEKPTAGKALREAELAEADARRALQELRQQMAAAREREKQLRGEIGRTESDIAAQRAALEAQLRLAYAAGREEWLRLALSQQDPAALSRRVVHYGYITRERGTVLQDLQGKIEALRATAATLRGELDRLADLDRRQQERLRELSTARKVRGEALATLNRDLGSKQQQLDRLRRDAGALQELLARLERERRAAARRAEPVPKAEPTLPAAQLKNLPVKGRMLASYGQRRADGLLRWDGLLLGAPAGAEVRSVQAGRVVYADWLQGMGLLLVVDHGKGYMSLYGHNQEILKKVGDRVRQGEVISRVGDSGGQGGPGLYFEMRRNGKPVDPKQWVR